MPLAKEDLDALGTALGPLIKSTVEELVKPIADNQKVIADTLAALPPAKKEGKEEGKGEEPKPLTEARLLEILGEQKKTEQTSAAAAQKKAELRAKVLAANGLDKLKPSLVNLPDLDDEAKLDAAAKSLVADLNASGVKLPDVGGVQKDGGKTKQEQSEAPKQVGSGLSTGQQTLASAIKLPGAAAAA